MNKVTIPIEPKDRLNDFAFGLSFFNEQSRADNFSDFMEELRGYLSAKYPFLSEDRIKNMAEGIRQIMLNKSSVHPVERQAGAKAGVLTND